MQNEVTQKLVHKIKKLYSQIYLKFFYKDITDEAHEYDTSMCDTFVPELVSALHEDTDRTGFLTIRAYFMIRVKDLRVNSYLRLHKRKL